MLILLAAINFDVRRTAVIRNSLLLRPRALPSQKSENHGLTPLLPPSLVVDTVIKVGLWGFLRGRLRSKTILGTIPK